MGAVIFAVIGLWLGFLLGRLGLTRRLKEAFGDGTVHGALWMYNTAAKRQGLDPEHVAAQRIAGREWRQ